MEEGIRIENKYEFNYDMFSIYKYSEPVLYYGDKGLDTLNFNAFIENKKSKKLFNYLHFFSLPLSKDKYSEGFVYVGTISETDSFKFQIFKVVNYTYQSNEGGIINLFLVKINKNSSKIISLVNIGEYFDRIGNCASSNSNIYFFEMLSPYEILVENFLYKNRFRLKNIPQNIKYNLISIDQNSELSIKILKDKK